MYLSLMVYDAWRKRGEILRQKAARRRYSAQFYRDLFIRSRTRSSIRI